MYKKFKHLGESTFVSFFLIASLLSGGCSDVNTDSVCLWVPSLSSDTDATSVSDAGGSWAEIVNACNYQSTLDENGDTFFGTEIDLGDDFRDIFVPTETCLNALRDNLRIGASLLNDKDALKNVLYGLHALFFLPVHKTDNELMFTLMGNNAITNVWFPEPMEHYDSFPVEKLTPVGETYVNAGIVQSFCYQVSELRGGNLPGAFADFVPDPKHRYITYDLSNFAALDNDEIGDKLFSAAITYHELNHGSLEAAFSDDHSTCNLSAPFVYAGVPGACDASLNQVYHREAAVGLGFAVGGATRALYDSENVRKEIFTSGPTEATAWESCVLLTERINSLRTKHQLDVDCAQVAQDWVVALSTKYENLPEFSDGLPPSGGSGNAGGTGGADSGSGGGDGQADSGSGSGVGADEEPELELGVAEEGKTEAEEKEILITSAQLFDTCVEYQNQRLEFEDSLRGFREKACDREFALAQAQDNDLVREEFEKGSAFCNWKTRISSFDSADCEKWFNPEFSLYK